MSSFLPDGLLRIAGGGQAQDGAEQQGAGTGGVVRSKEEERALRLAALATGASAGSKRSPEVAEQTPSKGRSHSGSGSGGSVGGDSLLLPPPPPPLPSSSSSLPVPMAVCESSPVAKSPKAVVASLGLLLPPPPTGTPTADRSSSSTVNIALNMALENIFQFTLRPEIAGTQAEGGAAIVYVGDAPDGMITSPTATTGKGRASVLDESNGLGSPSRSPRAVQFSIEKSLTADNVNELIPKRLSDEKFAPLADGALGYLVSCYRRAVAKESMSIKEIKELLIKVKRVIVNWAATTLSIPDLFPRNSENAVLDLLNILLGSDGSGSMMAGFLADLAVELADRKEDGDAVVHAILALWQQRFDALPTHLPQNHFVASFSSRRSVMDNLQPLVLALQSLCRCHKSVASQVALSPNFALAKNLSLLNPAPPPLLAFGFFAQMPTMKRGGAAIESNTLLGRLLSAGVDPSDPQISNIFNGLPLTMTQDRQIVDNIQMVRTRLNALQSSCGEILTKLLGAQKQTTLEWLKAAIEENSENGKTNPDPSKASSRPFMFNLCAVLLQLCRPIMSGDKKSVNLEKVNWRYLTVADSARVVPRDMEKTYKVPAGREADVTAAAAAFDPNFNSILFFLCWRGLQLGFAPLSDQFHGIQRQLHYGMWDELRAGHPNAIGMLRVLESVGTALHAPNLMQDAVTFCSAACTLVLASMGVSPSGGAAAAAAESSASQSLLPLTLATPAQLAVLSALPQDFTDVLLDVLLSAVEFRPEVMNGTDLAPVLQLVIFFLRRPWAMQKPHSRAHLGKLLHNCFLPREQRREELEQTFPVGNHSSRGHGPPPPNGLHTGLLSTLAEAQQHLAPTLLRLYGDVDKTGYYEKITHRRYISAVLRSLWSDNGHRAAFRRIVTESSGSDFVPFATGVLGEISSQFVALVSSLSTIKSIRDKQQTAEWAAMTEELREQDNKKVAEAERAVKSEGALILEVLGMVNYLSSDDVIRRGFLDDHVLKQFTDAMLCVVLNLTGKQSLQFKLADTTILGFDPKDFLVQVCQTIAHVADFDLFRDAVIANGYYKEGVPLTSAVRIVKQFGLASAAQTATLTNFVKNVTAISGSAENKILDDLLNAAPEEFLDGCTCELMKDPVRLPKGNQIVDRSTLERNEWKDPFSNLPVAPEEVEPQPDLKQQIEQWRLQQQQAAAAQAAAGADAMEL